MHTPPASLTARVDPFTPGTPPKPVPFAWDGVARGQHVPQGALG